MSKIRGLAKETIFYGAGNILSRLLNMAIAAPYLTNIFNDETGQYGIHGLMYAFAALLMIFFTYGMETSFFRFGSEKGNRLIALATASRGILISTPILMAIFLFFATDIAAVFTQSSDWMYVVYFVFIIGFDALSALPFANLRLENKPLKFIGLKLLNVVINAIFLVFALSVLPWLVDNGVSWATGFYHKEHRLHYVFVANLLASILVFFFLVPTYYKVFFGATNERGHFDKALWLRMLNYAWPLVIVGIAGTINQLIDRFLLKEWLPGTFEENTAELGIYNGVVKLAVLILLFTQAFKFAAEPFFFKHAGEGGKKDVYAQVAQLFTLVGSLFFLGVLLYIDIAQYIIASNFRAGLHIVPVLMIAYLLQGIYYNFATWFKVTDNTIYGAYIAIAGAVVVITSNYFLIPRLGMAGAAWSVLICFGTMTVLAWWTGRKHYPIPYPLGKMATYIAAAIAVWMFSEWLRPLVGSLSLILGSNTLLLMVYLLFVYWLDRPMWNNYLKKNFK